MQIGCYRYELSDTITDSDLYMCWANCTVLPDGGVVTLAPNASTDQFSAHINPNGHYGLEKNMYTFFDVNNPSDSISVIINFITSDFLIIEEDVLLSPVIEIFGAPNQTLEYQFYYVLNNRNDEMMISVDQNPLEISQDSEIELSWNDYSYFGDTTSYSQIFIPGTNMSHFEVYFHAGSEPEISVIEYHLFELNNEENAQKLKLIFNTTTVGINESERQSFSIYPNPSYGDIFIEVDEASTITDLIVYDFQGREILNQKWDSSQQRQILDLPAGNYLVRLLSEEDYFQPQKLIIQYNKKF